VTGNVLKNADGAPVEGATVIAISDDQEFTATTAADGTFSFDLLDNTYNIFAGAWGYREAVLASFEPTSTSGIEIRLNAGYKDDFILDLGWTVSGDAVSGIWERAEPIATFFQQQISNPGSDSDNDEFGELAYITGNGGGGAGDDDVDDGTTTLTSLPMDLSNMSNPTLTFEKWFYNAGGNSLPNDELIVYIMDGLGNTTTTSYDNPAPTWRTESILIDPTIFDLSQIIVAFETSDAQQSGHLVEAGIDKFEIVEGIVANENLVDLSINIGPNPFDDFVSVSVENEKLSDYIITDVRGKTLLKGKINGIETTINTSELVDGIYFIQLSGADIKGIAKKLIKQ